MDINIKKEVLANQKIESAHQLAKLIKNNDNVVIKISASWCGPCKNKDFLEKYNKLKQIFLNYEKIKFVELDIDNDSTIIENKEFFDLNIDSVPTFIVSKDGDFTNIFSGTTHLETIYQILYKSNIQDN